MPWRCLSVCLSVCQCRYSLSSSGCVCVCVQDEVRAVALRVLREMVRCQPERFHSYAELTILKLLEAHKDPVKEVM